MQSKSRSTDLGARRAMNNPTMRASGNRRSSTCFTALKWQPVMSTSSTTKMVWGGRLGQALVELIVGGVTPPADGLQQLQHAIVVERIALCLRRWNRDEGDFGVSLDCGTKDCRCLQDRALFVLPLRGPTLVHRLLEVEDQLVGLAVGMPLARSVFTCVVANVLRVQIVMIRKCQGIDLEYALSQELP